MFAITKENAGQYWQAVTALTEGRPIQTRAKGSSTWSDTDRILPSSAFEYRARPNDVDDKFEQQDKREQEFDKALRHFNIALVCFSCAVVVFVAVVVWRLLR